MKKLPEDFLANINKMSDKETPIAQPQADKPIQSGKTLDFEAIRKSLDAQQAPIQTAAPEGVISSTAGFVGDLGRKAVASTAGLATRAVGFLGEAPARIASSVGRDIGIVENIAGTGTSVGKKIKEFGDIRNQSQYETTREAVENIDWFWKNNMKDVVEEANNDPQGMLEKMAYVPKEGLKAIADNAGNFIAAKVLPAPVAFFAMAASERGGAIDKMVDNGVDFDIANKWGTLYGLVSGGVEYSKTVSQLGIAGLKKAGLIKGDKFKLLNVTPIKKILEKQFSKTVVGMLENATEEAVQAFLQDAATSRAVAEHNKRNPDKQIEFESTVIDDMIKSGASSLMMDAVLTAFGLGKSYLAKRSSALAVKDIELQSKSLDVSTKMSELVPNKSTSDMTPEEVRQGIVNLSRYMDKTSAMKVVAADPASRPDVIEEVMFPEGRKDRIAKIDEINKQTELIVQQEKQVEERNAFVEKTKQELAKDGTLDSVFKDPVAFDKLIEADSGGEIAAGTLSDKERQDMAKTIYDIYGLKPEENISARLDEMLKEESDAGVKISSKERKADLLAEFPYAQDAVNEVLKQRSEAAKASKTVVEEGSLSPRKKKIQEALAKKAAEETAKTTYTEVVQPSAAVEAPKATIAEEKTGEVLRTQGDKPGTVDILVKSAGIEAPRNKDEGIRVAKELLKKQDTDELTVEDINSLKQNQVTAVLKASGAGKDIYSMGSRQVKDKALEVLGITKKAAPKVAGPDIVQAGQVRIGKDGSRIEIGERVGDSNKFNVRIGEEQKQLSVGELGTYETEERLKVRTVLRDAIKPNGGKIDYTDIEGVISGKDAQRKFGKDFNLVDEDGNAITSKSSVFAIRSAVARELGVETTEAGQKSPESPKRLIEMLESEADGDVTFDSISDAADKILANRGDYSLTEEGVSIIEAISDNMERFSNDEFNEDKATENLKKILESAKKTKTKGYRDEFGYLVETGRESLGKDVVRAIDFAIRGGSNISLNNPNASNRIEKQIADEEDFAQTYGEDTGSRSAEESLEDGTASDLPELNQDGSASKQKEIAKISPEKYITNVMEKTQSEASDEEVEEASINLRDLVVKEAATRPDILKAIKESGSRTRVFEIASDLLGEKKMYELSAQAVNMVVGDVKFQKTGPTINRQEIDNTVKQFESTVKSAGGKFTKGTGDVLGEATIGGTKIVLKSKPQIVTPDRQYASGYTVTKDGAVEIYVSERDGQITTLPHEIGHASYEMLSAKDRETLVNQFGDIAKNNTEDLMKKVEEQYSKNKNIGAKAKLAVVRLYRNFAKLVNVIAGRSVFNENKSASEILTDLGNGRVMAEFNAIASSKTKSIAEQFQKIDEKADKSINKVIDQQEKLKAPTTIAEIRKAVIAQYGSFKEAEKAMKKGKFDSISKMLASNMSAPPKSGFTKEASNLVSKGIKKQIDAGRKEIKNRSFLGRSAAGRYARWYREHQSHFMTILESVAGKDASGVALRQIADGRNKEASIKLDATAILDKTRGLTKAANLGRKDFIKDHNKEQIRGFTTGHRVQLASYARSAFLDRLIGLDTAGIKDEIKKIALEQARGDKTLAKQYSKAIDATVYSLMGSRKTKDGKKEVIFDPDMPRSYFIKTRSGTHEYKFTARELNHIYRTLGKEQKAWIEGVQDKVYAMTGVRLGVAYGENNNGKSLGLLPIYIPQVKNYTPETREQKITEGSVENPMTHSTMRETLIAMDTDSTSEIHSRKYSDAGLMMIPAQELLMRHVNDTASYVGMDKFFNEWKSAIDDNKADIINYFGDDAYNTARTELINAEGVKDTGMKIYEKIANSLVGRIASVTLKDPFIMMYQPVSAMYYGRYFGIANFGKALRDVANPSVLREVKEVRKYATSLELRYKKAAVETQYFTGSGYYGNQFRAESKTDNVVSKLARFTDKGMARTDKIAIDLGIAAALNYVREKNPELRGEALYREAAIQASMATHMTQVSGDPLFMSELRQSKNIIPKTISYMTGALSAAFNVVSRDVTAAYRDPSPENIKNLSTSVITMLASSLTIAFIKHSRKSLLGRGNPEDNEWVIWETTKGILQHLAGMSQLTPYGESFLSNYLASISDDPKTEKARKIRAASASWMKSGSGPYGKIATPVIDLWNGIDGMMSAGEDEEKLRRSFLKTSSAVWRIGDVAARENTFGWAKTAKDFMDANGLTETSK